MLNLNVLKFDKNATKNRCVWLIGDEINAYILWSLSASKFTQNLGEIESYNLFGEQEDMKCVFTKELAKQYGSFLEKSDRANWSTNLLIRADMKQLNFANKLNDDILVLDELKKSEILKLFDYVIKEYKLTFNPAQLEFINKYIKDLGKLMLCNLLNQVNIDLENWPNFLPEKDISWYSKMKDKTLLQEGLIDEAKLIPIMQYMMRGDGDSMRRAMLYFLDASIKDGGRIFENNELWKDLLYRFVN